jgi:magnesium transporter
MAFVSSLMDRPVVNMDGERVGTLKDIVASVRSEMRHPVISALIVRRRGGDLTIPMSNVAVLVAPAIVLTQRPAGLTHYEPQENDVYLVQDVLDKQIIDTDDMRVVRVNDLELVRVNGNFYVANVDIGGLGLLRRLGLAGLVEKIAGRFGRKMRPTAISWDNVELLPGDETMRLKVPSDKMADLHPADLAEILSDLSRAESSKLLETLDVKTLADTLEEVEPDFQASLVEQMSDDKVADVLEEMAPDEAADLLAELPNDRSQQILNLMEDEEAEDVRKLLTYPEDRAGGIMNTEYVAVQPDITAEQTIAVLRETAHEAETVFYVYVTDEEGRLIGVFSLRELILASPSTPVSQFMHKRVVSVNLLDTQSTVAQIVAKYNLLAVPVVDDQDRLHGIVTADDALDKIIPTAWKKRLPRLYR